jgi:nucleoid-associated protein YgaU
MNGQCLKVLIAACAMACASALWAADAAPALAAAAVPTQAATTPAAPVVAATTPSPSAPTAAASAAPAMPAAGLDARIQDLKGEVIRLNRDLLVLEEELLFPAGTQLAVFVSMDVGKLFALDSVQIRLDDKIVANYLYTPREVEALHRGGVQRLYLGNLRAGEHSLVAFFTGKGPHDRDYKRGATLKIDKGTDPKYIELQIKDSLGKLQPEFDVKVWQ